MFCFLLLTYEALLGFKMCPLIKHIDLSERAKAFWEKEDIDDVFNGIFEYLDHLKRVLKKNTATDKGRTLSVFHDYDPKMLYLFPVLCSILCVYPSEYIQGQKLLEALDCSSSGLNPKASVVQVVIGSGNLCSNTPATEGKACSVHNHTIKLNDICSTYIYIPTFFETVSRCKTRCCRVQVSSWWLRTPSPAPVPPLPPSL